MRTHVQGVWGRREILPCVHMDKECVGREVFPCLHMYKGCVGREGSTPMLTHVQGVCGEGGIPMPTHVQGGCGEGGRYSHAYTCTRGVWGGRGILPRVHMDTDTEQEIQLRHVAVFNVLDLLFTVQK